MRRGGALIVLVLMVMRSTSGVMRVDRVNVQLIGYTLGFLQSVIGLHRWRWLHSRKVRKRLQSALISGTVTGLLGLAMWR